MVHTSGAGEEVEASATHGSTHSESIHHVAEAAASESLEPGHATESRPASAHEAHPVIHRNMNRADVELTFTDSISYLVMVRPDDYLGKIARREYDNPGEWRVSIDGIRH